MSQPPDRGNPLDPMGFWRSAQDATFDSWSKTMIELVNSQPYAEATARLMDTYLTMSIPMRKLLTQTMEQALGEFNIPTRTEVVSIAERMTNIEMRLDDLDARLDDFARQLSAIASAVAGLAASAASAAGAQRSTVRPSTTVASTIKPATKPAAKPGAPSATSKTTSTSAKPRKAQ